MWGTVLYRVADEDNTEWGIRWIRMCSQETDFYGRLELRHHYMLTRIMEWRGTSVCRRERGQSGKQRSWEGLGLRVGVVVGLRGRDVSSTLGGMASLWVQMYRGGDTGQGKMKQIFSGCLYYLYYMFTLEKGRRLAGCDKKGEEVKYCRRVKENKDQRLSKSFLY